MPPKPWEVLPPGGSQSEAVNALKSPALPPGAGSDPPPVPPPAPNENATLDSADVPATSSTQPLTNTTNSLGYNNSSSYGGGYGNSYGGGYGSSMYGGGYGGYGGSMYGGGYGGYGGMGMGMGMGRYGGMGGGMHRQGPDNSGDWFVPVSDEKTTLQKINDWNDATIDLIHIKVMLGKKKINR